jgi:hypothetical protein
VGGANAGRRGARFRRSSDRLLQPGRASPAANRPDGTDADYTYGRLIEPHIHKGALERIGGQLFVASGRAPRRFLVAVVAYRAGGENSQEELPEMVSRTFDEFDLTAEIT